MGVNSLNRGTILTGVKYNNFLAGNEAFDYNSDILISSQVLSSTTTTVTFSDIPQGYKNLQIRWTTKNSSTATTMILRMNGNTGSSYTWHYLSSNGSSVNAANSTSATSINMVLGMGSSTVTSAFGMGVIDVLNYSGAVANKTARFYCGVSNGGTQNGITLGSGFYNSTAAITSITVGTSANNFAVGSRFSLYGSLG